MLNERFTTYFQETFFAGQEDQFKAFLEAIEKPIPRTIRIKPGKEKSVKINLEKDGWILTPTNIQRVYSIDRRDDFNPYERRLGFSLDHLLGNFYIQELAAATPVDVLANGVTHEEELLILDMASSPGGKTTQLAEYFPHSFIIANEPTRERIPQLLQNLDRMETPNVGVTLYPGQYWKNIPEVFDRILLDAPCSGEGTLYKGTDAVKHWHIKNIKEISRLQIKLFDAGLHSLKIGGEMIYSTCSLNLLENESVIESMSEKYENSFEIIFQKKFWPHIDGTGGFFITKIRKIKSIKHTQEGILRGGKNEKLKVFRGNIEKYGIKKGIKLYEHDKKILAVKNIRNDIGDLYFMRFGEQIGNIENGQFEPNLGIHRYMENRGDLPIYEINDEKLLDSYLRGMPIERSVENQYNGKILLTYNNEIIGMEEQKGTTINNTFPKDWRRK